MTEPKQDAGPTARAPAGDRLDSWKEVAAYLKRAVITVQRWEKHEGLPVHRHLHGKLGSVWANKPEIDAWWQNRRVELEHEKEPASSDAHGEPAAGVWKSWQKKILLAGTVAAILFLPALLFRGKLWPPSRASAGPVRLVVLPFENLTGDPQQEYFSDGLTEEMISQLAQLQPQRLRVIARTSAMQFKATKKGVSQIGQELNVHYVLEGSVRQAGARVRISAQLIQVSDQTHLWAETFERERTDLFGIQNEMARRIASSLALQLLPHQEATLSRRPTTSASAYEAYLQGRFYWNKRSDEGFRKSIEYFKQAIHEDPNFSMAYVGLADAYALFGAGDYAGMSPKEAMTSARVAAEKALQLDSTIGEAHASLGLVDMLYAWDWQAADREYRRAIELSPGYAIVHDWYAYNLSLTEQHEKAVAEIAQAHELDPVSVVIVKDEGTMYYLARRFDRAMEYFRKAIEMDPHLAVTHWQLGLAEEASHKVQEGIGEFRQALALSPENPVYLAALAHAYASSGRKAEALRILAHLEQLAGRKYVTWDERAAVYVSLGQMDRAFQCLEKAYEDREESLPYMKLDWKLDPLRADRRFQELARRVGLPI